MQAEENKQDPQPFAAEIVQVSAKYIFNDDERAELSSNMADKQLEKENLESEKQSVNKDFGQRIGGAEQEISSLAQYLRQGYKMKIYEAKVNLNFGLGRREYINVATGEILKTEPLTEDDKQARLPL